MTNKNGTLNPETGENLNELLDIQVEELDETALREKLTDIIPKYKETNQSNKQLFERAKAAEGGLKELKAKLAELEKSGSEPTTPGQNTAAPTSGLDDATLDFFELKGYSDPDQVDVFRKIMEKTGISHREVIKDEYALAKVKEIQEKKDVQGAMPSSRRSGSTSSNDVEYWKAKYEESGELPDDFALRSQVINAKIDKENQTLPPWRR